MLKVGVVGCGGIGNAHANAWTQVEGVQLAAVCDLDFAKAQAMAEKYNTTPYGNIDDLPADLDIVSVVTPPSAHYGVVKTLLERGKNVFCEKPLTVDVAQGEELDALAKAKGLQLGVGFKMRFEPVFQMAKNLYPEIGKLVSIVTTKLQKFDPRPDKAWVTRTGAMYELSIHDFDLLSFITGKFPEKVIAAKVKHSRGWEKEDSFNALVDYSDGVTATLQGMYCDDTKFCFRDLTITLLGELGYMRIERPDRIVMHTNEFRVVDVPKAEKNQFIMELEHFRDAVLGKCENTLKAADANKMTRLIEDIRSAEK